MIACATTANQDLLRQKMTINQSQETKNHQDRLQKFHPHTKT